MTIVAYDYLTFNAEPCTDESEFTVAVCGLVEIHKVHINAVVWQFFVELRVQVEHRLFQCFQRSYPHFSGRERVHPHNNTYTFLV